MLRSSAHLENMNNTSTSCHVEHLQGLAYTPLFLLGFLINAAALRAFIAKRASWTDTHIYMFNLAIADSALVLFLPFRIFDAYSCLRKNPLVHCPHLRSLHQHVRQHHDHDRHQCPPLPGREVPPEDPIVEEEEGGSCCRVLVSLGTSGDGIVDFPRGELPGQTLDVL
ncbi:unnamed protein product [Pleuronectes platessa]|uniref:G-protein coupled receptors family 1 profile domain-containing protein n=1 Tax=Pleuronectes platessa TaxID=8262 RepID=A0A9N7Z645_PLEPL|nr:unnamed protein product [Pleuronectes platessa]